ncbi:MAG: hypothetical protein QXK00_00210 [archaeon]
MKKYILLMFLIGICFAQSKSAMDLLVEDICFNDSDNIYCPELGNITVSVELNSVTCTKIEGSEIGCVAEGKILEPTEISWNFLVKSLKANKTSRESFTIPASDIDEFYLAPELVDFKKCKVLEREENATSYNCSYMTGGKFVGLFDGYDLILYEEIKGGFLTENIIAIVILSAIITGLIVVWRFKRSTKKVGRYAR